MAGGLLLFGVGEAFGQRTTGGFGGGGTGGTGGFGGGTGGTGTFAGGGGFSGTGTFAGGGTGTFAGGGTGTFGGGGTGTFGGGGAMGGGGFGARGTTQFGATSPFGRFLGNPLAAGRVAGSATQAGSVAAQNQRAYPATLSFGATVTDSANLSRTGNLGTTGLGTGLGGALGNTGLNQQFRGASSIGLRRAPAFLTEPVFEVRPAPAAGALRADLQAVVARSDRLQSRDNIRVTSDGEAIVLSGQVGTERERQLAERIIRMTPGVREVRNDLTFPSRPPAKR